jgi:hypothetical protein
VRGFLSGGTYDGIPLEMNAYELDARFASAPAKPLQWSQRFNLGLKEAGFRVWEI